MALTPKQQRFVSEYLIDLNATQAATRAGYSQATANREGSRLLSKVDIQDAIAEAVRSRSERTQVDADRVIRELARIAFVDPRELFAWGPGGVELRDSALVGPDAAACVESVLQTVTEAGGSVRLKLHSKPAALRQLGEHLGLFKDRDPLEVLLGSLPPDLARALREALGRHAAAGGAEAGGGPAPAPDRSG